MVQESLSALLDGECSPAELDRLLNEMERSPELKAMFSRQLMTREAGEGTRIRRGQACICAGVMGRIQDEPMADFSAKLTDLDARRRPSAPRFLKSYGGLAAAASVAVVAVLVAMPALKPDASSHNSKLMPQVSAPNFAPVSIPMTRRPRDLRSVSLTPEQAEAMDELNGYLMEHSSSLANQGVGGTLRYARFAAHTPQQMPAVETAERR